MQIAVSVNGYGLVVAGAESRLGILSRFEDSALTAVFGFQIDPFDIVFFEHRMADFSDIDMNRAVLHRYHRQMLFAGGFCGVGHKRLHFFSAAHHGNIGFMKYADQVATATADIKFLFHLDHLNDL